MLRQAWALACLLASTPAALGAAADAPTAHVVAQGSKLRLGLTFAGQAIPSPASETLSRHEGAVWIAPLLAWLEGDSRGQLAVRAARWNGAAWGPAETVSPPGPGSQLALAGATMADGSAILVWSAFDGTDDEVVWSRRGAAGWTKPERIAPDDASPDILPSLAATADGALAAWSRYDGNDYRVVVARLTGSRWTAPETIGPKGSYNASIGATGRRAALVFQTAAGWEARELDRRGRPTGRRAAIAAPPSDGEDRATLEAVSGRGVTVRWRDSGAAASAVWR